MPLIVKNTAPARELTPAGTHVAMCIGHYHIGTQHSKVYNKDDDQIIFSFALDEKRSDGKNYIVSTKGLTTSFGEKANLTKLVKGWLGQIPAQNDGFDTSSLVGRQCLLTIVHEKGDDGNTYDRIQSVISPPKGTPEFRYDGNTFDYSPIDPGRPIPEEVPRFIQEKIMQSKEWVAAHGQPKINGQSSPQGSSANGFSSPTGPGAATPIWEKPKPPMNAKGYIDAMGLPWPFDQNDLGAALDKAAADSAPEEIAEARVILEPLACPF